MRRTFSSCLLTLCLTLGLNACTKEAPKAPAPQESSKSGEPAKTAAQEAKAEPASPKAEKGAKGAQGTPSIDTTTEVVKTPKASEGVDDASKKKLAKVYTEIYCAQRKGESEKLLDIYTKNGFDDPETWTKVWTKAAEDGAWVAQTTHDAIRACGDQSPPLAEEGDSK